MKKLQEKEIRRTVELSAKIAEENAKEAGRLTFLARPFVQASLPHSDPGSIPVWFRKNGNLTLTIRPGYYRKEHSKEAWSVGVPYGTIPRLILFWLTKECILTGKREINLGGSFAEFIRKLNLNDSNGSGKRGDGTRLKDQLNRLLKAAISIEGASKLNTNKLNTKTIDMSVASALNLWNLKEFNTFPDSIPEGTILLNENFFNSLTHSVVPLDERIILELRKSSLALDLYAFLVYRGFNIEKNQKPVVISWEQLQSQCGGDYTDVRNFSKKAKEIIKKLLVWSPNIEIEHLRGRIEIKPK